MLDAALDRADFSGFAARREAARAEDRLRGIGIAHYCERVAGGWSEHAWLELDAAGKVTALVGTMSNGQGHETAFAQLVADALGVEADAVTVVQGDTDRIPSGHGTGGSASLSIAGAALAEASQDIIRQALPLAAELLEAAVPDIEFAEGAFRIAGTDRQRDARRGCAASRPGRRSGGAQRERVLAALRADFPEWLPHRRGGDRRRDRALVAAALHHAA